MEKFKLLQPHSLNEALGMIDGHRSDVRPFSGGTAIMLMMKSGIYSPKTLLSLRNIPDIANIRFDEHDGLCIGASVTLDQLEKSDEVMQHAPVVSHAMKHLANQRVRNVARVGGALAHGDPHMDLPPILVALESKVIASNSGVSREIPLIDFYKGYYETALDPGELIIQIKVPSTHGCHTAYIKSTTRTRDDWPAVGVAVHFSGTSSHVIKSSVILGAISDRPIKLAFLANQIAGLSVSDILELVSMENISKEIEPISDALGSADYKLHLAEVYTRRAIKKAFGLGNVQ